MKYVSDYHFLLSVTVSYLLCVFFLFLTEPVNATSNSSSSFDTLHADPDVTGTPVSSQPPPVDPLPADPNVTGTPVSSQPPPVDPLPADPNVTGTPVSSQPPPVDTLPADPDRTDTPLSTSDSPESISPPSTPKSKKPSRTRAKLKSTKKTVTPFFEKKIGDLCKEIKNAKNIVPENVGAHLSSNEFNSIWEKRVDEKVWVAFVEQVANYVNDQKGWKIVGISFSDFMKKTKEEKDNVSNSDKYCNCNFVILSFSNI